jgi:hypothetical protein
MLTLIIYFLCVYVVFKGVEILQIALMSSRENRKAGIVIGVLAVAASIVVAAVFGYLNTMQALEVEQRMRQIPNLNF